MYLGVWIIAVSPVVKAFERMCDLIVPPCFSFATRASQNKARTAFSWSSRFFPCAKQDFICSFGLQNPDFREKCEAVVDSCHLSTCSTVEYGLRTSQFFIVD